MYLKSLEIQGFKSFPDKISLRFGDDITAIVGPNGSGKSNISDAIRWVMGEQSTRALRGAKMEDVIFGGTQKRPQLGFAEASLIFDNSDRYFPIDNDEVMVTRRYYRSGENEFYINRQSARLKDVNELFMDTGLGKEGYSNISQGRIDEILSVKSTDRREIFEEAAGISKFRHRKEETERRLERTEDNLLRINDKISELELQVEPLREQSEKARRFLELREELQGVEVALWLQSLERLGNTARKAEEDYNAASFELTKAHQAVEELYARSEALNQELHTRDTEIEAKRQRIAEAEAEQQRLTGQKTVLEAEKNNLAQNVRRLQAELAEQDTRSGGIQEQIGERRARIAEIDRLREQRLGELSETEQQLQAMARSSEGMNRDYLELRNRHAACAAELAGKQADMAAIRESVRRAQERRQELSSDAAAAAQRKEETDRQLQSCRAALQQARDRAQSCGNTLSGYALRRKTREEKALACRQQYQELCVRADTTASKQNLFREMEREYEGYSKAVKFVMHQSEAGALQRIHGPVSRLLKTDDRYTLCIEIALGGAMQHIVVDTEQDAKRAILQLKSKDAGRATFLPLSATEPRRLSEGGLDRCAGFVGIASDLVRCQDKYRPVMENLLGKTVIAETLDDAISMAKQYRSRFRIVTLDGQVMNPGGSMTGGSVNQSAGMLSRANELERLRLALDQLNQEKQTAAKALAEANRQLELTEFEITAAEGELRQAEDSILRLEGEQKQFAILLDAITRAEESNRRELEALERRMAQDEGRSDTLSRECDSLTARLAELQTRIEALSVDQTELSKAGNDLAERLTGMKVAISALAAEKQTALDTVSQLEGLSSVMETDRGQKQEEISRLAAQTAALDNRILALGKEISGQEDCCSRCREQWKQAVSDRAAVEAERTSAERQSQQKNKDVIDMEREAARLESRKNAALMEEKQIIDKLWESYELTPSTAPAHAAQIESVTAANRRLAELRRQIHGLGTPNLGAIEEFARVSERYAYLSGQRDDVLRSKGELEGIIRDLTRHMTEIFTVEFARINGYFQETFREMFGGGKASLELEDPTEPLACGIEIKVQPPGKQLKTITLLSGGEKAFVAIALYFSILKVRPTPFCMLDEIDAALDDRNVERFSGYLRQLCKKTQFIVITHRRGTMEEADALFGVTMQEQGVSKLLHLDLDSLEKELKLPAAGASER